MLSKESMAQQHGKKALRNTFPVIVLQTGHFLRKTPIYNHIQQVS